ncbi:P-loop NTPase fold protein [Halomonas sp. MC140]|nr:P-loop NTPase fold protein [Halomonas sp. MC140]MDN7131762.1 P-loop NTPase fold protein [Halomonas sp. MC140]
MAAWDNDLLGRVEVAQFLQNLLESDEDINVINIDSPWGTGKTFFLENWKAQLEKDRGVVYFNAWKKDYTGDPFVSLVSAIKDQLSEQRGIDPELEKSLEGFVEKASKAIAATTPILLKFAAKGLARKLIGFDTDGADEALKSLSDDVTEAAIHSMIESSADEQHIVDDFTKALEKLVAEVAAFKSQDENAPVYILIDELDRCRPTYAIELLERVKHFFNVPGCKFVIATDTGQLQHSIKAIYGSGFDSNEYLKRFFDLDYSLDNDDIFAWARSKYQKATSYYCLGLSTESSGDSYYNRWGENPVQPDQYTVVGKDLGDKQAILIALTKTFDCSLRSFERNVKHLDAALSNVSERTVHFFFMAYLIFLKNKDLDVYDRLRSGGDCGVILGKELPAKYHPYKLYFNSYVADVHEVALEYFKYKDMSRKQMNECSGDSERDYVNKIKVDKHNNNSSLNYERIIRLAAPIG